MAFDVRALRYFVRVAELGSIRRAAAALNIAQPALTQQMAKLEAHLGVQLLVRSAQGVQVTPEGRRLLESARGLLTKIRSIEEELSQTSGKLTGWLNLAVPPSTGNVIIEPLVRQLWEQHPGLRLRIAEARISDTLDGMVSGRFDLAILAYVGDDPRIISELLFKESLHLVASAQEGLSGAIPFERVLDYPLALSDTGDRRFALQDYADKMGREFRLMLASSSLSTTKRLIAGGSVCGIMTWSAAADGIEAGTLSAARIEPMIPRPLYLCHMGDRQHSRSVKVVSDLLKRIVADLAKREVLR